MPIVEIPAFHTDLPTERQLADWESQLVDRGYLVIPDALPAEGGIRNPQFST